MRNQNYIKFGERSFYFMLGAVAMTIVKRLHTIYGMETTIITLVIAILVLWIIQWVSSFKNRRKSN